MNLKSTKKIITVISSALVMCVAFAGCAGNGLAAEGGADPTTNILGTVLPIIALFAVFYFFMIRPENKKKKKVEEMRSSLGNGDKIVTIGGIMGEIVGTSGDSITIETGEDRVRIKVAKWAISRKDK